MSSTSAVTATRSGAPVEAVEASASTIPTDGGPESDGTLEWDSTTIVVCRIRAGGETGLGYTYGSDAVAGLIEGKLASVLDGRDAFATGGAWHAMRAALRNAGQAGAGAQALSAVDIALHDLKAKLLGVPVHRLLGTVDGGVPIYASGGFCSWDDERLAAWTREGAPAGRVKIKVGREPERDLHRLEVTRAAAGPDVELMVDANGAYPTVAEARHWAGEFGRRGVTWLEEPLSSDDIGGLRAVRETAPGGLAVAAGEYAWSPMDARRLLEAQAVDVLQLDVTRCGGFTGALAVDALAEAFNVPTSLHCAPAASAQVGAAMRSVVHLEHFHDHVRIEGMLFEGAPSPKGGWLAAPDRPGIGLRETSSG
jgi:L-alanine-DL-glutamate epimerase-like enolase superfamily enzyme